MGVHTEYWWVRYNAEVQPAEVDFVGGIPAHFRFIGKAESIPAASAELVERLPAPPKPVLIAPEAPPPASKPERSSSLLWFVGVLLLIFVTQCSGAIFDAIK